MKNHFLAFMVAFAAGAGLATPAIAQTSPPPSISVSGEATVTAPPDLVQIDAGVTSEAKTAREASDANNSAMGKVLLALKDAGISEKDYQTSRLSLQPQSATRPSSNSPTITGFRATNQVTIRLRDVTKVASIIDTITGAGANEIGGIRFAVSSPSKLMDDARAQAVADARRKAEIYAMAAGVTLGAPLNIVEAGGPGPIPYAKMTAAMAPSPISPGEETLHVTVSMTFALRPNGP